MAKDKAPKVSKAPDLSGYSIGKRPHYENFVGQTGYDYHLYHTPSEHKEVERAYRGNSPYELDEGNYPVYKGQQRT